MAYMMRVQQLEPFVLLRADSALLRPNLNPQSELNKTSRCFFCIMMMMMTRAARVTLIKMLRYA